MKLINIRLNAADAAALEELQQQGLTASDLLRQSVREQHQKLKNGRAKQKPAKEILADIFARYPDIGPLEVAATDFNKQQEIIDQWTRDEEARIKRDHIRRHKRDSEPHPRRRSRSSTKH